MPVPRSSTICPPPSRPTAPPSSAETDPSPLEGDVKEDEQLRWEGQPSDLLRYLPTLETSHNYRARSVVHL